MLTTTTTTALVVGTDGTPAQDRHVIEAAQLASARGALLHVVCSVRPQSKLAQRRIDGDLPADMTWMAGAAGQREAAMRDVHELLWGREIALHVTTSTLRLGPAAKRAAAQVGGEVYGSESRRLKLRLPALGLRARATT